MMKENSLQRFWELRIDPSFIGLEKSEDNAPYFCTPVGAQIIGWECGGIHYCFIDGFDEMVFAVNPMPALDKFAVPVARSFEDFLRLILYCKHTSVIEQISWMDRAGFENLLKTNEENFFQEQVDALKAIEDTFSFQPITDAFSYVKNLQENFDYSKISFSEEYYDTLGIDKE